MKKFKKLISCCILIAILICTFGTTAGIAADLPLEKTKYFDFYTSSAYNVLKSIYGDYEIKVKTIEVLKSFDEAPNFLLITFEKTGYAVVYSDTGGIAEAAMDAQSPYETVSGEKYYGGPLNYAYKRNSEFYTVADDCLISEKQIEANVNKVNEVININKNQNDQNNTKGNIINNINSITLQTVYIPIANGIRTMPFGNNVNGTCGSIAAGIMLQFFNSVLTGIGSVIPYGMTYGEPVHQMLIPYCEMNIIGGSTSDSISNGINQYISGMSGAGLLNGIKVKSHYMYVFHNSYVVNSINEGKPCVVTMSAILGSPKGDHVVTTYGYIDYGSGCDYYISHLGHQNGSVEYLVEHHWTIGVTYLEILN